MRSVLTAVKAVGCKSQPVRLAAVKERRHVWDLGFLRHKDTNKVARDVSM